MDVLCLVQHMAFFSRVVCAGLVPGRPESR